VTIVTDPDNNETAHEYGNPIGGCAVVETATKMYSGLYDPSANPIKAVVSTFAGTLDPQIDPAGFESPADLLLQGRTTTDEAGGTTTEAYTHPVLASVAGIACSTNGTSYCEMDLTANVSTTGPDSTSISGYGSSVQTSRTYQWVHNPSSYREANLLNLVYEDATKKNSSSGNASLTDYGYDETSISGSPCSICGDQTSVIRMLDIPSGTISTSTNYNSQGMPVTQTDALMRQTTTTYDATGIYPQQINSPSTSGISHITGLSYDPITGSLVSRTDENSQKTQYSYDAMGRLWTVKNPDARTSSVSAVYCYPDARTVRRFTATSAVLSASGSSAECPSSAGAIEETLSVDGLGRVVQSSTVDSTGPITTDTVYDSSGRIRAVSNPHRTTSTGWTSYYYDALGRKRLQCQPDNASSDPTICDPSQPNTSYQEWNYSGNTTTFYDEMRNAWQRQSDALGRLTQVIEPNGNATRYSYNELGSLTGVNVGSVNSVTRSFYYDSLSRLIAANNPENTSASNPAHLGCGLSGTLWSTCYSYYANGNLFTKTDNRDITTTYAYDELNRLIAKTYTDPSTLAACYRYDTGLNNSSVVNGSGRLSYEWTQPNTCAGVDMPASSVNWRVITAYDPMGRLTDELQCPAAPCAAPSPMHYSYDLAGNITHQGNGLVNSQSPQVGWTNHYDNGGRLSQILSDWSGPGHPATLFKADGPLSVNGETLNPYGPFGLTSAQYGVSETDGSVALAEKREYDNRGRLITKNLFGSSGSTTTPPTTTTVTANPSTFVSTSTTMVQVNVNCNSACGQIDIHVDTFDLGNQTLDANGNFSISSTLFPASALAVGQHTVTAQYLGDSTHAPSSGYRTYTVLSSNQFLTLSMNPNMFTAGENSKIQIHAVCNSACGQVSLSVDNQYWRAWDLDSAGNLNLDSWVWAGASSNFNNLNQHTLTAHYNGNSTYPPADSNGASYTIQSVGTQQIEPSLTMSSTSFTTGENSHIIVHHDCNSACGQIVLTIDNSFYRVLQLDSAGNAAVDTFWWWTPLFTTASHTMVAQYLGNHTYAPANSQAKNFQINGTGTQAAHVTLSVPNPFNPGSAADPITVNVDCNSACGVVQLTVDGNEWRDWTLDSNGHLTIDTLHWPTPLLTTGSHTIRAHYYGNSTYAPANSDPQTVTVLQFLTLSINPNMFTPGENSTIQVHAGCSSACGQVSLSVDNQLWRAWDLDFAGNLSLDSWAWAGASSNFNNLGQHTLTAHYNGNANYASADSEGAPYTIQSVGTQQVVPTLTISNPVFTTGENSQLRIHHDCNSACGQVVLTIDNSFYRVLPLDSSGNALVDTFWWWTPLFTVGQHTLVAQYLGNHTYAAANSQAQSFEIKAVGTQQPNVTLLVSSTLSLSSGTVTVNVDCNSACGVVRLDVDGNEWRDWTLDSTGTRSINVQTWRTPLLTPGSHSIRAHFYGNANYAAGDSPSRTVTVVQ